MLKRALWLTLPALVACYDSHLPAGGELLDVGSRPDTGVGPDAVVAACPVDVTDETRFVPDNYMGDSYAPHFAMFPDGDLAISFAGRDARSPYITYLRTSSTLEAQTAQVNVLTESVYTFGYPVVHTGVPYILYGGLGRSTLVSLGDDGNIVDVLPVAPETSEVDWLSPAADGFLATFHSGGIHLVYIGFDGALRSEAETEAASSHMSRSPIPRPTGRAHVFAYVRQAGRRAILREGSEGGVLGPAVEFPGETDGRVELVPMGVELWLVRSSEGALLVDRADADTLELIEEHRLDALPDVRAATNLEGRLLLVSSRTGDREVNIDYFSADLATRCRITQRLDGPIERSGFVSSVETDGAVVIGGEVQRAGRIEAWAARVALRP